MPLGRRDSAEFASQQDVLSGLPPPTAAVPALLDALAKIKLDATDLVALSAATPWASRTAAPSRAASSRAGTRP